MLKRRRKMMTRIQSIWVTKLGFLWFKLGSQKILWIYKLNNKSILMFNLVIQFNQRLRAWFKKRKMECQILFFCKMLLVMEMMIRNPKLSKANPSLKSLILILKNLRKRVQSQRRKLQKVMMTKIRQANRILSLSRKQLKMILVNLKKRQKNLMKKNKSLNKKLKNQRKSQSKHKKKVDQL